MAICLDGVVASRGCALRWSDGRQQFLFCVVAIFADNPLDPNFLRQLALVAVNAADLADRDVIVVFDATLDPVSELRKRLRPRGFSLVILDKDGSIALRKPLPWDTREISRVIDKFPSRRDEVLLENAAR